MTTRLPQTIFLLLFVLSFFYQSTSSGWPCEVLVRKVFTSVTHEELIQIQMVNRASQSEVSSAIEILKVMTYSKIKSEVVLLKLVALPRRLEKGAGITTENFEILKLTHTIIFNNRESLNAKIVDALVEQAITYDSKFPYLAIQTLNTVLKILEENGSNDLLGASSRTALLKLQGAVQFGVDANSILPHVSDAPFPEALTTSEKIYILAKRILSV